MAFKIPFFKKEVKANPPSVTFVNETNRGSINKVLLPNHLLRPPFGVPRFKNVLELRRLASTPQASMAKQTVIDEVVSVPWAIKPIDETDDLTPEQETQIDEMTNFLRNPNTNPQSLEYLFRVMLNDLLDLDSGIWVKEYDEETATKMVSIVASDGATFLKNPNIFGKFDNRADFINQQVIDTSAFNTTRGTREVTAENATQASLNFGIAGTLSLPEARERAAYFQFGFLTSSRPIAFGRKEVVWFERNPQSNQIYGKSPLENILAVLQTLKYSIEYNLDYFEHNNVPKGFITLPGANEEDVTAFAERWADLQLRTNVEGLIKKDFHQVPIVNTENADFVNIEFSPQELQLIDTQQWFSKLVWAMYGVTPSEVGFTDDSNRATEVNQSRVFKRKAVLPLLRLIEFNINHSILSEWDFGDKYKFEFNTFDIVDERSKAELYELQLRSGWRTKNEIRKMEGLTELDEMDLPDDAQTVTDDDLSPDGELSGEETSQEQKSFEKKNIDGEKVLNTMMQGFLKEKEKLILDEMKNLTRSNRLSEIKSFEDVLNAIERIFLITGVKAVIDQVTASLFNNGVDEVERTTSQNIAANTEQIKFLSDTTFGNIKGMTDDLKNKLRQQLRFSVINGEGITKITERVKGVFDISENRAEAIARTETARAENAGQLQAAKDSGLEMKKYITIVSDSRTSEVSKAMERKYGSREKSIGLNETFSVTVSGKEFSGQAPPFMPNDRDSLITFVDRGE